MFIPEFPGVSCTKEQKWSQKYFDVLKYAKLGIFLNPASNSEGFDKKMENLNRRGVGGLTIMEFQWHGGIMHFGHSEG